MSSLRALARHPVATGPTATRSVGVVVASYNYAEFLTECVRSVLSQQGVLVKVLIMDDASPDDTAAGSADLASLDDGVEPFRNERNLGHIATFNRGFRLMEARHHPDYLVKLDADDEVADGALARAVALMEAEPSVSFVYGRPRRVVGESLPTRSRRSVLDRPRHTRTVWPGAAWLGERCRTGLGCISNPEVVIRGDAFRRLGGQMDEALSHTYDFELWLRLAAVGDVGHVDDHFQGVYRIHDRSMMRTVNSGPVVDLRGRLEAFGSLRDPLFDPITSRQQLLGTASYRIAQQAVDAACRAYERGRGDTAPVRELLAVADEAWPGWQDSSVGRRWRRRKRLGPRRTPYSPLVARVVVRRLSEELTRLRWQRHGV